MTTNAAKPTTKNEIFVGGPASGQVREISKSQNFIEVPILESMNYPDVSETANHVTTDKNDVVTYRRRAFYFARGGQSISYFTPVDWSDGQTFQFLLHSLAGMEEELIS